jgi:phage gp36-like protein
MQGSFGVAQQILSFGQERYKADVDSLQEMLTCRDLASFIECNRKFTKQAASDYATQTAALLNRVTHLASQAAGAGNLSDPASFGASLWS